LNLGGIANVTVLDEDPRRVVAFDTGPANAPLDRLARILTDGASAFDVDGRLAASGTVDRKLLAELLEHPFLRRSPPKSTGVEAFGDAFVKSLTARRPADAGLLATLTAFVAESVAQALRLHVPPGLPIAEVVVAGGGALNPVLMSRLSSALAPAVVVRSEARGVPAKAREAMAFAILAHDAALGLPTSLPSVTGARHASILGKLSFPRVQTA
jgi:anhydro-N-acetylmuramic acid kinase